MVEWHRQFSGHEFEPAPGDGEGQGGLACCGPQACEEQDRAETEEHQGTADCVSYLSEEKMLNTY